MYPRHGAFVEGAEFFDAQFFGISSPEARFMDPQQRVLLEASLGGLLDAGFSKQELMGLEIAVHVGLANNDWIQMQSLDLRKVSPYTATGMSSSIAAARVSYSLGLKGPSYIVDTACSSALVALESSAMSLRRSRSVASVNAAANIMMSASTYISFRPGLSKERRGERPPRSTEQVQGHSFHHSRPLSMRHESHALSSRCGDVRSTRRSTLVLAPSETSSLISRLRQAAHAVGWRPLLDLRRLRRRLRPRRRRAAPVSR